MSTSTSYTADHTFSMSYSPSDSSSSFLALNGTTIFISQSRSPTPTSQGHKGEICIDEDYIYVCYAENAWKKIALS